MDTAIIIAALILNPIARRKRAALASEPVSMAGASPVSTSGTGGSNPPEKSDLGCGDRSTVGRNLVGVCGTRQDLVT